MLWLNNKDFTNITIKGKKKQVVETSENSDD